VYIIVLNVHALSQGKSDDSRNSFYEELEQVYFNHFSIVPYENSIRAF
jgi:hypothetical protein